MYNVNTRINWVNAIWELALQLSCKLKITQNKKFGFFWSCPEACGILVPQPDIEPTSPLHWKCGVLTIGLPGKSLKSLFKR